MASDICVRRLNKELKAIARDQDKQQDPRIVVCPLESNILEMHYVIEGGKETPYEGGIYHGKLIFPKEYPLKPPGVMMLTPSGRFTTNKRLCLSMSDFHPESWNPMWSVMTIITGLYSFMLDDKPTFGSIETTLAKKKQLAEGSLAFNVKQDKDFPKLFPEYVQRYHEQQELDRQQKEAATAQSQSLDPNNPHHIHHNRVFFLDLPLGGGAGVATLVALLSIVVVYFRFL